LCIVTGKYVWKLGVEVTVVQDDGNVVDAVGNAVVGALLDMRKPMVMVDKADVTIILCRSKSSPPNYKCLVSRISRFP
jgi:exosome complex RNA-binding protein Rrp42 (RNase PH superfamily)